MADIPDNPNPTPNPGNIPGKEDVGAKAARAFEQGSQAFSDLIKKFEEQSSVLKSATKFQEMYLTEIEKGRISSKLAIEFEKKKAEVQNTLNKLNEESAVKILQYQQSLQGLPWQEQLEAVGKYQEGLDRASKSIRDSLSKSFQLDLKKGPIEAEGFGQKILKGLLPKEGIQLLDQFTKASGGTASATNVLLAGLGGVALKIASAVGIFSIFQIAINAVTKDLAETYSLAGALHRLNPASTFGEMEKKASSILPRLRESFTRTTGGIAGDAGLMEKMVALGSEESSQAISNFTKLLNENKLTLVDLSTGLKNGKDVTEETILALDTWGRASQYFGLTSEQGAEKAGKATEVFKLVGTELDNSFQVMANTGTLAFQTFDKATAKIFEIGEATRYTSKTPTEALIKARNEVEKFGNFIKSAGDKAGFSGAAISQMFDLMWNRINNLSLSFKIASLNASGLTQNMPIGESIVKSILATPSEIIPGLLGVFAKSFGTIAKSSDDMAGMMIQALQLPADEARKTLPTLRKFADVMRDVPGVKEGKFDMSQFANALKRADISKAEFEKVAAASKAAQDPMLAIQKMIENLMRLLTGQFNAGVLVKAAVGLE